MATSSSGISFSGLASGIDTNSMVTQLVALEQTKVTAVQKKQDQTQLRLTALGTLQGMLTTMDSKSKDLSTLDSFSLFSSNSSDPTVATIAGSGEGIQGNIGINVRQLASSWKIASNAMTSQTTALSASGTLSLSKSAAALKLDSSTTSVDITIGSGDSLKDIAAKINSAAGAGMTATIVNFGTGDTRLMLNGVDEGSNSFTLTEKSGGNVMSTLGLTKADSTQTSSFGLRLQTGGPATPTSTLGSLYTGIGQNNVDANDKISLTYSVAGGASSTITATAATISAASGTPTTDMKAVTTQQMADWMKATFGGKFQVAVDSSGEMVATNPDGVAVDFSLSMGKGTLPLGGSSSRTSWANVLSKGQNAFYSMNGMSISSASNADATTFTGATVNLKSVSTDATTQTQLTLNRDTTGIQKKVQDFLDSYNSIIQYIDQNTASTVSSSKDANGLSQNKVTPGDLTGDTSVGGIKSQLRTMLTSPVPGLSAKTQYDSLASVGILTDKDTGGLAIDQTKFQAALAADFDGVRRLFANSGWTDNSNATVGGWTDSTKAGTYALSPSTDVVDGKPGNRIGDILFSQTGDSTGLGVTAPTSISGTVKATFVRGVGGQIQQYINTLTSFDGAYNTNKKTVQQQIDDYSKQADTVQTRVDTYRKTLVAQFSAMENAMLKIKNQSSAFAAQIGG